MMFIKYLCCKERLSAKITTGEIKSLPNFKNPMLEVHIALTMGSINPSTDFLYLSQQISVAPQQDIQNLRENGGNPIAQLIGSGKAAINEKTGSTLATNTSRQHQSKNNSRSASDTESPRGGEDAAFGGPEDKDPLPRRLRDVRKDRVILIERGSALCDNVGLAYVDYMGGLEPGRYRLYFMRIESEQRIMYNSRLEVIGASNAFSVNNVVTHQANEVISQSVERNALKELLRRQSSGQELKESVGGGGTVVRIMGEESFNDSSDLDSLILMNQIQGGGHLLGSNGGTFISNTQSVHSSEQTLYFNQSPVTNSKCNSGRGAGVNHSRSIQENFKSLNSSVAGSSSQYSQGSSTVTFIVKNENEEALIVTQSRIGNPGALAKQSQSKHRRGINIQSVLEDIQSSKYTRLSHPTTTTNNQASRNNALILVGNRTVDHAAAKKSAIGAKTSQAKKPQLKTINGKENKATLETSAI